MQRDDALEKAQAADDLHEKTEASALPSESSSEQAIDEAFLVVWDKDDPLCPTSWSALRRKHRTPFRWYLTALMGLLTLNASYPAAAPSGILPDILEEFNSSRVLGNSLVSFFLLGYVVGPIGELPSWPKPHGIDRRTAWGPLSEHYGRRPIFIIAWFPYLMFQIGSALAPNMASLVVFRFLGGTCAGSPLALTAAVLVDIWEPRNRAYAFSWFALGPFVGPIIAPVVSGYISVSGQDWRLAFWVLSAFAGACFLIIIFTYPETYHPVLLARKAAQKRKETGDDRWRAAWEAHHQPLHIILLEALKKPFIIFFAEPMVQAICAVFSLMYAVLFSLFQVYPIVFGELHSLNAGEVGLCFIPLGVGGIITTMLCRFYFLPRYEKKMEKYAPLPVPPEERLAEVMLALPLLTVSYAWFAATASPDISFWVPMMSGLLQGSAIQLVFTGFQSYLGDAYTKYAATALAISTITRALLAASFPLFLPQLYREIGPRYAGTLLTCLMAVLAPTPFLLYRYGGRLRAKSRFANSSK